ncbi:hypothetical protein BZG36_01481 [Bifiguratus adelaidae]|uniref:Protein arginine N-methyltransferase n=1 Tax=Bifiguratus adelaidae TaxID=1938954 RepID=A0A261Y4S3_9FUNG|nr:hypothetical protein BZG36_01481 [Bifiguratus adelaidae]
MQQCVNFPPSHLPTLDQVMLSLLEFYSGIGGMHFAILEAGLDVEILKAFDINTTANAIYAHNFGKKTVVQRNIEALPLEYYDKLGADIWTMSPPCQPYTRTGKKQGSKDMRAKSFLYLMDMLPKMQHPPSYILLENVKGFEESDSRDILVEALKEGGYCYQELLLTPLQYGIPNSRLRYYMLAKKKPLSFTFSPTNTILGAVPSTQTSEAIDYALIAADDKEEKILQNAELGKQLAPLFEYLVPQDKWDPLDDVWVPMSTITKYGRLFDIVKPSMKRSCCFTKGYHHFVEATGSVLQMNESLNTTTTFDALAAFQSQTKKRHFQDDRPKETLADVDPTIAAQQTEIENRLSALQLRFFTPREIANLMGFPAEFSLPSEINLKQRYRALGNSVNVKVVAALMRLPIGVVTDATAPYFAAGPRENGEWDYDFMVKDLTTTSDEREAFERHNWISHANMLAWRSRSFFTRQQLKIDTQSTIPELIIGRTSRWFDFDSEDANVRINSEVAFKQEIAYASHIGLMGVLVQISLANVQVVSNWNRVINSVLAGLSFTQLWIEVPLLGNDDDGMRSWRKWDALKTMSECNLKMGVALRLSQVVPYMIDHWLAEPVKALIISSNVFIPNNVGYPVLPKRYQPFLRHFLKLGTRIVLDEIDLGRHKGGPDTYYEYIRYLERTQPELDPVETFATGYHDYLQAPLQPLMDNLESSTYETFERDPVKYQQYEEAVYRALIDFSQTMPNKVAIIMVAGAGRGPLVTRSLNAAERASMTVKVYALEKNANAIVGLQHLKDTEWGDKVNIVFSDMRKWKPTEKVDILVSELLGSFGDNELSPECLDGAQKFLKPNGVTIPTSYTTYISPLASSKLHNEVAAYKDLEHFETPYVVMFRSVCSMAPPEALWEFCHPNRADIPDGEDPINNYHNIRYSKATFHIDHGMTMHGIAGYFESVLYKDVTISIHPKTHSPGMFSWFPIFFPLRQPINVPDGATVEIDFWRLSDERKVWYEWTVSVLADGTRGRQLVATTPLHNIGGRSYWIGL